MSLPKWFKRITTERDFNEVPCQSNEAEKLVEAFIIAVEALESISTDNGPDTVPKAKDALRRIEALGK